MSMNHVKRVLPVKSADACQKASVEQAPRTCKPPDPRELRVTNPLGGRIGTRPPARMVKGLCRDDAGNYVVMLELHKWFSNKASFGLLTCGGEKRSKRQNVHRFSG